jgi:hypothetical protein
VVGQASVTIAMVFEGHVVPAALMSFARLVHTAQRTGLLGSIMFSEGGVVDGARNKIVAEALGTAPGMTHLLWVDPQLVVPGDAVARLVASGHQVAGAVTPRRAVPAGPAAYDLEPFRWLQGVLDGPCRVGGLGLGCTLVEARVFRRLQARHGDQAWHKCFYGRSEDVFFFERCRGIDVDVWLDPSVPCEVAAYPAGEPVSVSVSASVNEPAAPVAPGGGPRVAVAVPLFEPIAPCAMTSLVALVRYATAAGLLEGLYFTDGLFYDVARNKLVANVLASPGRATHVLWIDSDMVVPIDALERLLAADQPIAGGLYHAKRGDLRPTVFALDPLRAFDGRLEGTTRVDGFGLGCALVRTSVYQEMAGVFGDRRWHVLAHEAGEDVWFFQRCKKMGIQAWIDTAVRCGHVRDQTVTTADWLASQDAPTRG